MKKRILGVPAFLIFVVFGLSGISIGLFSSTMAAVLMEMMDRRAVPPMTLALLEVPATAWIVAFFLMGVIAAIFFEKLERREGVVPSRTAGLIAMSGLVTVLLILISLVAPFISNLPA